MTQAVFRLSVPAFKIIPKTASEIVGSDQTERKGPPHCWQPSVSRHVFSNLLQVFRDEVAMAEKTQERPLLASSRSRMGGNSFFCLFALLGALKRVLEASLAFAAFAHASAQDFSDNEKGSGSAPADTFIFARPFSYY
jgi:hypothetical protein